MKKEKNKKINQRSFYFQDYNYNSAGKNKNEKLAVNQDRVYLLFFVFFCLIFIFATKIFFISLKNLDSKNYVKNYPIFKPLRNDILDRNGDPIARNVVVYHVAIKPNLIKDKKKFIIKLKLLYPELNFQLVKRNLEKNKYFYLKKNITQKERNNLWSLGEKGLLFERTQTRIYPHKNLFSHVIGQIDLDNNGISGVEKYFDKNLKNIENEPLNLSLDINLQYLIREELIQSISDFKAKGAASVLMDAKTGEVLSLISLPDYNLNTRQNIKDKNFTNKITKGVFELGSIFKTFTIALAMENDLFSPNTIIKNIPDEIKCSKYTISEHDEMPSSLSLKQILIRSSNIGTIKVAKKIGENKLKTFLEDLNLLNTIDFELDEIGSPLNFSWNKCKLETVSYGHGITTTPLQAVAAYASISNGGIMVDPTLVKKKNSNLEKARIVNSKTSKKINSILREVVTSDHGTASLAEVDGYYVGGKTGTANKNINGQYTNNKLTSFISIFPTIDPEYILLVLMDEPKPAPQLVYNYRGKKISGINRNESGWNSAYTAGKIIEKIGPILAINKNDFYDNHVVKKSD
tara:strand:- start:6684 stop:8408 length:1725 start_codon:yes stop_codon:yes gene_type:complete